MRQLLHLHRVLGLFSQYVRATFVMLIYAPLLRFSGVPRFTCMPNFRGYNGQARFGKRLHVRGELVIAFDDASSKGLLTVGNGAVFDGNLRLSPRGGQISMGDNIFIGTGCFIQAFKHARIDIGRDVMIAPATLIIASNHVYSNPLRPINKQGETGKGISIGNDVWIGCSVTILDGISIGDGSIIGAGSIITHDVPPNTIYIGKGSEGIKTRQRFPR